MPVLGVAIDAREAKTGSVQAEKSFKRVSQAAKQTRNELGRFQKTQKGITKSSGKMAASLRRVVTVMAALLIARRVVNDLVDFEQALVGVGKTADLSGSRLAKFGDEIIKLSTDIPIATSTLLEIGQAAGQLGVKGTANILLFTETIAKLGNASDLAGEEAAKSLARILNVTGESVSEVAKLASVLVSLGNNAAASEREIARITTQVAQATAVFKIGSANAAAIGTAMAELGIRAELGGSAVGRTFRAIDKAIRDNGVAIKDLSSVTGRSVNELTRIFREDATKGFEIFLEALKAVTEVGGDTSAFLKQFGLNGEEILKVLPTLALNIDGLRDALKLANAETTDAIALNVEAARSFDTLGSSFTILRNTLTALNLRFRNSTGSLRNLVDIVADVLRSYAGLDTKFKETDDIVKFLNKSLKITAILFGVLATVKITKALISATVAMKAFAASLIPTKAGLAAVLKAVLVLTAALVAVEFGRFLFDEFKIVRQVGISTAFAILEAWENFQLGFKTIVIIIVELWGRAMDLLKKPFAEFLRGIAKGYQFIVDKAPNIAKVLNFDGAAAEFNRFADEISKSSFEPSSILDKIKSEAEASKIAIDTLRAAERKAFREIEDEFAGRERKGRNFIQFLKDDIKKAQAALKGLNLDFDLSNALTLTLKETMDRINEATAGVAKGTKDFNRDIGDAGDDSNNLIKNMVLVEDLARTAGDAIAGGIADALFSAEKLSVTLKETGRQIAQQIARQAIARGISAGLDIAFGGGVGGGVGAAAGAKTTIINANGNAFNNGRVVPFQAGGIVNTPTTFPLAGGNTGLMGEAGPEAIFPLVRKGGKLAIEATGGGGGGVTNNINFVVNTQNADSFRQSRSQIIADLSAAIRANS